MKKIIAMWEEYNPKTVADCFVERKVRDLVYKFNSVHHNIRTFVSSELMVLALRVEVKLGNIKPEELLFIYDTKEIKVDKHGELSEYPDGFCDRYNKYLLKLV